MPYMEYRHTAARTVRPYKQCLAAASDLSDPFNRAAHPKDCPKTGEMAFKRQSRVKVLIIRHI